MHDDDIRAEFADYPDTLTVRQLAEKLGWSTRRVYGALKDKRIPGIQLEDESWLIFTKPVVNWLIEENHKNQAADQV